MERQHRKEVVHVVDVRSVRDMGLTWLFLVAAAIVFAGYMGFTMLLFLPLLALRKMFPYRAAPFVVRTGDNTPHNGARAGNAWASAATGARA